MNIFISINLAKAAYGSHLKIFEYGDKCDFGKLKMLDNQIFMDWKISKDFAKSMHHLTSVKSAYLNLSGSCVKPKYLVSVLKASAKDLLWVKIVAPISLLRGIVGISVAILGYVFRDVLRRQNKMLQGPDILTRENEFRLQEQMTEY